MVPMNCSSPQNAQHRTEQKACKNKLVSYFDSGK